MSRFPAQPARTSSLRKGPGMPRRAWASVPGPPCSVRLRTESPALPEAQRAPRATSALAQPARSCSRRPSRGPWGSTGNIMDSAAPRSTAALLLLLLLLLLLRAERTRGAELTFELPDSAKQCFHEDVEQGVKFSLDYQVRPGRQAAPPLSPPSRSLLGTGAPLTRVAGINQRGCSGWE